MLNIVLLVTAICIVIVLILYLFYWNRFVGYIFGLIIRLFFWRQGESSVWVDIGAIHFSILSGRILFKDLRYHSSNQTIKTVKGQISWRYWIRRPAEEEDLSHAQVVGEENKLKGHVPLRCRIHISIQGLEWFIYNRTAAYDNIASRMESETIPPTPVPTPTRFSTERRGSVRKIFSRSSAVHESSILDPPVSLVSSIYKRTPTFVKRLAAYIRHQLPIFDPKNLLPMSIEATKAAFICGNASTPSLLVAEFSKAEGTFGVVPARSRHDLYKQLLNFKFHNASVCYVENVDHRNHMATTGEQVHEHIKDPRDRPLRQSSYLSYFSFEKLWDNLPLWSVVSSSRPRTRLFAYIAVLVPHLPATWPWTHAPHNTDEETPLGADFSTLEYAIERKILEAPELELLYYADVVGIVPQQAEPEQHTEALDPFDIGNGDLPPEWGMDFVIRGGYVRYGPWADRQRVFLHHAFFPQTFYDMEPTARLKPGDQRMWTGLKIFIELRDGVTLQIPFREASKDWQWDGKAEVPNRPRKREPASIHVKAGDSSTISYIVPMVAGLSGYMSFSEVHLDTVTVTSSLNDVRLITADSCRLQCHLPSPLKWNDQRQWTFTVSLRQTSLFLLRDHINMLTDLGKDWSTGPPSDYYRHMPMLYAINVNLHNYELNLYVNDHNIIDKPLIKEDNALLTLRGTHIHSGIRIPFLKYRPETTTVAFWIQAPHVAVSLTLPRWNIHSLFATPDRSSVGNVGLLRVDGTYQYFAEVHESNVERLNLDVSGRDVIYKAFGWTVRHFMVVRDNYFGSFTHFSTLYEYLQKRQDGHPIGDPIDLQYRDGSSNPLEVRLAVRVDRGLIVLPAGVPGYESCTSEQVSSQDAGDLGSCVFLNIPSLQFGMKTNDFYMEMSLNVDTISGHIADSCVKEHLSFSGNSKESFVIDDIDIVANRLFGPRPRTSTYVCVWEIHVGHVKGILSAYEGRLLSVAGSSFGLNFTDSLNAPAKEFALPLDPDVTFFKFTLDTLNIAWHAGSAVAELAIPDGLRFDSNDLASKFYRKVTSLRLPQASVRFLLNSKKSPSTWYEASDLHLDANLDMYSAPFNWEESARAQLEFIAKQDELSGRVRFLYIIDNDSRPESQPSGRESFMHGFYLPQLRLPPPSADGLGRNYRVAESLAANQLLHPRVISPPLTHQSESDYDDGVTEMDRDARLANSRPIPSSLAAQVSDGEESLLSGEESDDEDLTDALEWDSDYSDYMNDAPLEPGCPPLSQCSVLTRHYVAQYLTRPSLWNGSPFRLVRNPIPRHWRMASEQPAISEDGQAAAPPPLSGHHASDEVDNSIVRFVCKNPAFLRLTPMFLPVLDELVKDMNSHHLSPELRLDALMAKLIQSTPFNAALPGRLTIFDAHVSALRVVSAQIVPSNTYAASEQKPFHSTGRSITALEFRLDGCHIKGKTADHLANTADEKYLATSFQALSLTLRTEHDAGLGKQTIPQPTCKLVLGSSNARLMGRTITTSFGNLITEIGHSAPTAGLATANVLVGCVQGMLDSRRHSARHAPVLDQQIIHQVLKYSRQRPVVDPLSTIQPSYLIQKGRPDKLRKNTSFKFLVYLRTCLRHLEAPERRAILALKPDLYSKVSLEDIISTLESNHFSLGLEDDVSNLSQQSLLQELFPPSDVFSTHHKDEPSAPVTAASMHMKEVKLSILHPDSSVRSDFSVGPLQLDLRLGSSLFLQSTTSTAGKNHTNLLNERLDIQHISVSIYLDNVSSIIVPQTMRFVQIVLRAHRQYCSCSHSKPELPEREDGDITRMATNSTSHPLYLTGVVVMKEVHLTAAAESLVVEYTASGLTYASTSLLRLSASSHDTGRMSTNHSLIFENMALQACSTGDMSRTREHAVLASLKLERGRLNSILFQDPQTSPAVRVVFGLDKLRINVPRSALRLYRFIEEWRAEYLPGIDAAIQELLSELHREPVKPVSISSRKSGVSKSSSFQLQASLASFQVTLQIMLGTWLSWEIAQTVAFLASPINNGRKNAHAFGLQMGPHRFGISSKTPTSVNAVPNVRLKLELPTFTLKGTYDETGTQGVALVEFFEFTMKPSDWDTVLSVQQKSGQDFNDLVHLIEETRQKRSISKPDSSRGRIGRVSGSFRMKGFRVGLEGLSSTLFLECDDINGGIENIIDLSWHLKLSDLALSLASSTVRESLDRGHRSAFVTIDFQANMGRQSTVPRGQTLQFAVTKVHAVMQPTSIGELGDLIDNLQAEVLVRKEERANELAEFKEKTRSIMRSLDVKIGDKQHAEYSWLDQYTISLTIMNIGVAFPLAFNDELQMPRSGKQADSVRAFLFSIRSLLFGTQRGESGQAAMKGFAFQFVSHFRQSVASDFSGDNHQTRNRLLYPEMTAQLRSDRLGGSRRICIGADVSGFILDVDSTIPDYVFSLVDVYHQGRDRMERFTSHIPRSPGNAEFTPRIQKVATATQQNSLPASDILLALTFASGKILMHSIESDGYHPNWPAPIAHGHAVSQVSDPGVEVFSLPVVSVWGEYRAKPASQKLSGSTTGSIGPSVLMFKATVHSSQNILRPTLLLFVTELVDRVEDRFRHIGRRNHQSSPWRAQELLPVVSAEQAPEHVLEPVSGMKISLSLRIDQSKLELTCQPDVNVIAGVNWDSGGFVVNIAPGARRIVFTGSVGGLTVGLKHGFLSDDCVKLDARNLAFNVTFAKMGSSAERMTSSVSVVLDTEFSGGVRFSRLQDVLCFKAVWLDRIPVFTVQSLDAEESTPRSPSNPPSATQSSSQELTTVVLLRLRQIQLDADLGQSISLIKLSVDNMLVRSRLSSTRSELSLSLAELSILASGNISGEARVPNFLFQTIRRKGAADQMGRMLDLTMTSGGLSVVLESEYQKLIQYRAEPVRVTIFDDWSKLSSQIPEDERRVDVSFTVSGTEVLVIMNVGTIPRLLSYVNKFTANLDSQKEGASRESKAFRISSSPKPDNPLTAVANAMLKSTRSRLKEADAALPCVIGQRMSLDLDLLQLVVFPRAMRDPDLAQFVGRSVHARLYRLVESNALPSSRDLKLSFVSITTSRITQLNHALVAKEQAVETKRWLSTLLKDAPEAIIFGLPSMNIRMSSHESIRDQKRLLRYDFTSEFTDKKGTKSSEDIYITLNMSLYSWLTILRKTFAREMEQVQAAADMRLGPNALMQHAVANRKKALEPLVIPADRQTDLLSTSPEFGEGLYPRSARDSVSLPHSHSTPSLPLSLRPSEGGLLSPDILGSPLKSPIGPLSPSKTATQGMSVFPDASTGPPLPRSTKSPAIIYEPQSRHIERLTMRQLGEATPDVMHPFFMKKAGFSLEDSLPQYVHEYATIPTESIMKALLKLYSKQLEADDLTNTQL